MQSTSWVRLNLIAGLIGLLLTLYLQTTDLDSQVAQALFNQASGQWLLSEQNRLWFNILYKWPKVLMVVVVLGLLAGAGWQRRQTGRWSRRLLYLVAVAAIVPAVVAVTKALTHMPCPYQLQVFGGQYLEPTLWQGISQRALPVQCFPAAHASAGYAWLGLGFISSTMPKRLMGWLAGVSLGSVLGAYKMAVGDHFLSHTLASLFIALICCSLLAGWIRPLADSDR